MPKCARQRCPSDLTLAKLNSIPEISRSHPEPYLPDLMPKPRMNAPVNTLLEKLEINNKIETSSTLSAPEEIKAQNEIVPIPTSLQAAQASKAQRKVAPDPVTLDLAEKDVHLVLKEQHEQSHILTTKLNILFVANGALLTSLTISRLLIHAGWFSLVEVLGFFVSFTLLVRAFLPRQVAVSPNLEDRKVLEGYLALSPQDYKLQMLANLAETYNANRQRLNDVSRTLKYAAISTWIIAVIMLIHLAV